MNRTEADEIETKTLPIAILSLFPCDNHWCVCAKSHQSCPTLRDPMDYNLPGSSVHGILQGRILE